jgi:hypothetical protein
MTDTPATPHPVPPGKLIAYAIPGAQIDVDQTLRPCRAKRDWMDEVPQKYIYRCVPLVAANTQGWEIINPVDATVSWNGGDTNLDLSVQSPQHPFAPQSHFGCGIVTWYLPFMFRTPPEMGLVVTGPANQGHDDCVPLDAFVRTDWLPFPFTMNWRLTRKNEPVGFKAGEPICRVYPFPLALLNETELEVRDLASDPAFMAQVEAWNQRRQENVAQASAAVTNWLETGEKPSGEGAWNSAYVREKTEGESGYEPVQTIFKCGPPQDKRG